MSGATLSGRRVIELGTMIAAPFATHILAELGAGVIKIEPPTGDTTRSLVRGGPSGTYIAYNRGKKSLCLDLTTEEGNEVFVKLVANADVVIHNLSPGATRKLKVGYDDCLKANPQIIYCHIRGYGPGPLAEGLASNPIAEAATGVMYANRIDGRPSRLGPSYHDQFAGCYAVIGVLSALLANAGSPEPRRIEFGLYETGLHVAARDLVGVQLKKHLTGRAELEPSGEFSMPGYGAYETSDGRWIYLVMLTDAHWQKFWEAVGKFDQVSSSLSTLRERKKQRPLVEGLMKSAVKDWKYFELADRLGAAGLGFTEVLPPEAVLDAPQARKPKKFSEVGFGGYDFEAPDFPVKIAAAEPRAAPPPLLGEHTLEILEDLRFGQEARDRLVERGVVVVPDFKKKAIWAPVRPLAE
jgi:crotonobetainyl-CoA:carnitine CoA-transferase CaiB-like acyl-CoA transferase